MKSLLRFLLFVCIIILALVALYAWRMRVSEASAAEAGPPPSLPALEAFDRELTTLVNSILPSVVSINAIPADVVDPRIKMLQQWFGTPPGIRPPPQLGSGAIVSDDGYIVTNLHVIKNVLQGSGAIEVQLNDGRVFPARVIGIDGISDVAVLKIPAKGLTPLKFGDSDIVNVGQTVLAVGNPFGLQETVTRGIISGKARRTMSEAQNEYFQTDAPINPGNSGGPLVNLKGQIIGINNWILPQTDGIGFAIPSNTVLRAFESIRENGRFIRPWFGINMIPLTPALIRQLHLDNARGALVNAVIEDSPAARAGIQPGDLIISYNGRPITDWADLRNRVSETEPGKEVIITLKREGKEMTTRATIEKQPGE